MFVFTVKSTLFVNLFFSISLLLCNVMHTSAQDDDLLAEAGKIFGTLQQKCNTKSISVQSALQTAASCAEPILKQSSNLIPSTLYPGKYKTVMDSCFVKLNQQGNMCDKGQLEKIKKCAMQKGFSALPELKKMYDTRKKETLELVRKLIGTCVPQIEKL